MKDKVKILDTTLRDGSYAINFSFTAKDTMLICKKLEEAGINLIEIGHGVGLNASNSGLGRSIQTDEEYMEAAQNALHSAKYGMFCIPKIAKLRDIDTCAEHNMGFIRIGTDVTKVEESREYVKLAKDHGMYVTANYMKSYAIDEEKFAQKVKVSEKYGVDMVYIVDSAGGMFPEDIRRYFNAIREVSDIPLGFHGHNNLGMAISNTLTAIELGIQLVDSSLQGLGRSSGNACTEMLVLALNKKGYKTGINYQKILDLGHDHIRKLIVHDGKTPLDIISGYADFHSSYMPKILEYSSKYEINPISLIVEISKKNKVNPDDALVERLAMKLKKDKAATARYASYHYIGGEQNGTN